MSNIFLYLTLVIFLPLVIIILVYNQLVRKRNWVKNSFKQIDIQLIRRHDLIPNILETAKKYMQHEETVFVNISLARSAAETARKDADTNDGASLEKLFNLEDTLSKAMKQFYAVSENYPPLKSDAIMQELQQEIISTENRITYSRQSYNDCVMDYNNTVEEFPGSIVAPLFRFRKAIYANFMNDQEQKNPPKISFD